jgi:hypothetical protein
MKYEAIAVPRIVAKKRVQEGFERRRFESSSPDEKNARKATATRLKRKIRKITDTSALLFQGAIQLLLGAREILDIHSTNLCAARNRTVYVVNSRLDLIAESKTTARSGCAIADATFEVFAF